MENEETFACGHPRTEANLKTYRGRSHKDGPVREKTRCKQCSQLRSREHSANIRMLARLAIEAGLDGGVR